MKYCHSNIFTIRRKRKKRKKKKKQHKQKKKKKAIQDKQNNKNNKISKNNNNKDEKKSQYILKAGIQINKMMSTFLSSLNIKSVEKTIKIEAKRFYFKPAEKPPDNEINKSGTNESKTTETNNPKPKNQINTNQINPKPKQINPKQKNKKALPFKIQFYDISEDKPKTIKPKDGNDDEKHDADQSNMAKVKNMASNFASGVGSALGSVFSSGNKDSDKKKPTKELINDFTWVIKKNDLKPFNGMTKGWNTTKTENFTAKNKIPVIGKMDKTMGKGMGILLSVDDNVKKEKKIDSVYFDVKCTALKKTFEKQPMNKKMLFDISKAMKVAPITWTIRSYINVELTQDEIKAQIQAQKPETKQNDQPTPKQNKPKPKDFKDFDKSIQMQMSDGVQKSFQHPDRKYASLIGFEASLEIDGLINKTDVTALYSFDPVTRGYIFYLSVAGNIPFVRDKIMLKEGVLLLTNKLVYLGAKCDIFSVKNVECGIAILEDKFIAAVKIPTIGVGDILQDMFGKSEFTEKLKDVKIKDFKLLLVKPREKKKDKSPKSSLKIQITAQLNYELVWEKVKEALGLNTDTNSSLGLTITVKNFYIRPAADSSFPISLDLAGQNESDSTQNEETSTKSL
eukprot:484344_1